MNEEISLNQFENLVLLKIRSFADLYEEMGEENNSDRYPLLLDLNDWITLFGGYLTTADKEEAIRIWSVVRTSLDQLSKTKS